MGTETVTDHVAEYIQVLERDGIVELPGLVSPDQLSRMQQAFKARLWNIRWNTVDGYEKTEPYRHMVDNLLTLDQGFVDVALHPTVKGVLSTYIGDDFQLVEARGWQSNPTRRDFHGWHGDEWYDQSCVDETPREVKLVVYLSDVESGAFIYAKGTHGKPPRYYTNADLEEIPESRLLRCAGPAGSAYLFDTTGIHRQDVPILAPRHAMFYNYHDPRIPLQACDVASNRYHPLILNAALLGGLDAEDQRILGFGDKKHFVSAFSKPGGNRRFHSTARFAHDIHLHLQVLARRIADRLMSLLKR